MHGLTLHSPTSEQRLALHSFAAIEDFVLSALYTSKRRLTFCVTLMLSLISTVSYAGGVGLGTTRVIYPADSKQVSLSVTNTDPENVYLLQSWIEDNSGEVTQDFAITPPLFVIKKKSENTLRLVYGGPPLTQDRETLFWVNVKAIPSRDKLAIEDGQNRLQLAVVSRIKLFYRPSALAEGAREAAFKVEVRRASDHLVIKNPTPYFINLTKLAAGSHQLDNSMVAPYSEAKLSIAKDAIGELTYSFVNDYGGVEKVK